SFVRLLFRILCFCSGFCFECFFFSSRRRHTRSKRDWSSDVCSSDLMNFAGSDGGQWAMAASLVKKYGVVPTNAMPESFNTNHTSGLADALARKERKDALVLRKLVQEGKTDRSEEHTSELQSRFDLVCRLLL